MDLNLCLRAHTSTDCTVGTVLQKTPPDGGSLGPFTLGSSYVLLVGVAGDLWRLVVFLMSDHRRQNSNEYFRFSAYF